MASRRRATSPAADTAAVESAQTEQAVSAVTEQAEVAASPAAPFAPMVVALSSDMQPMTSISLGEIVSATQTEAGFLYTLNTPEQAQLAAAGLIELNPNVPNTPEGFTATRATPQGIQSIMDQNQQTAAAGQVQNAAGAAANTATAEVKAKPVFEIETLTELPKNDRAGSTGAGRTETYPFAALAAPVTGADGKVAYSSFFVAGKEASKMASTVNGANARYAEPTGNKRMTRGSEKHPAREVDELRQTRKFEARNGKKGDVTGVYIVRTL